ncbi:hypothetical protein GGI25_002876 [Coemansia spiralis]|uniref:J domain-containing protein n=2 Tax=Coemansia TaxID=4863 RepID=A0A9W8KYW3_9FUNG|nr:DnaJ domain-containing protein [Coemansia spiralis]KAJ1992349.1 hypothetical protein EDC05_002847 [Coemansia umbellata]KAJ2622269.1 hypothetical protein GGI26_003422 [Coemansia sp. RSA 1358]KAJ2677778.1 hypothetical protein GGI25_002876 [Coemansia spiralis]
MRLRLVALVLLCLVAATLVAAWEKLDHEIFELYDDIKKNEATADWYELLQVQPKSTIDEINRSFRQLSKKYHPDKLARLPHSAAEKKRFQRITLVVNILRDKEARKRYNFFRKNGVPAWRGTGYLYRRWRPGFGTVIVGLLCFASLMQYLFHHLSYWRARERIRIIEEEQARSGSRLKIKTSGQTAQQSSRRVRRQQKKKEGSPSEVDSGIEDDMEGFQINTVGVINPYSVEPASVSRVLIARLPMWVVTKALSAVGLGKSPEEPSSQLQDADEPDDSHRKAVDDAIRNLENTEDFNVDPEMKSKKAAKKAAKTEARRRRQPVV